AGATSSAPKSVVADPVTRSRTSKLATACTGSNGTPARAHTSAYRGAAAASAARAACSPRPCRHHPAHRRAHAKPLRSPPSSYTPVTRPSSYLAAISPAREPGWSAVVVGDQGPLDRGADEPVVPDAGVEGQEALHDPGPEPGGDPAAVAFEAELILQRPDDRFNALPQPVREVPGGLLVPAGRADQGQAQVRAGEERLGFLAGQALVGDDRRAGGRAVGRPVFKQLPGLVPLTVKFGVGQAEPGDSALAGADEQQLGSPVPAGMAGAVAVPGIPEQVR